MRKSSSNTSTNLEFLAQTAGAVVEKRFSQKLDMPNPRTFVGAGKLEEIKQYIDEHGSIDVVIFDDELSSGQLRNIERELQIKILDRTNLILDIFARARPDVLCTHAGRTGTVPIPSAPPYAHVDTP